MSEEGDDKPTVVLDLNALKKEKLKQEEDLANIESELEFNVGQSSIPEPSLNEDPEKFAEKFLNARGEEEKSPLTIILFDFQSDFFQKSVGKFPKGHNYQIAKTLPELNKFLTDKHFQIVVFNYDTNPKAVNQLTAQIKSKFPHIKTMIMARAISAQKALIHAKTPSGANGYYQFPLIEVKIEAEFQKIKKLAQKQAS